MSELYELPSGWEWKILSDVCLKITDGTHKSPKIVEVGNPYITVRDIDNNGKIDFNNCKSISDEDFQLLIEGDCMPYNGDVLFSKDGTVGKVALVNHKIRFVVLSSLAILRPSDLILPNYLDKFLQSPLFLDKAIKSKTGAAIKRVILRTIKTFNIPLPLLQEQKRIVAKLDKLFEKIDMAIALHQKNMDEADVFMESVLNDVFGELKEKGLIIEKQLNECFIIKDGTHDSPKYVSDGFPLFTSKNLKDYGLDTSNFKSIKKEDYNNINKRSKVDKGDLLFAMIGTIGNPTIVGFEPNFAIKNVALFKPIDNKSLITYLRYYLMSEQVITKMRNEANGATQKFVGLTYLRQFPFPISNINIQQQTVTYLDKISKKIENLKKVQKEKMQSLVALKASILDRAFRGEL